MLASPAPAAATSRTSSRRASSKTATRRRNELVIEYQPMVERLVRRTAARVRGLCDADELRSAANLGLMEAVLRFDASKGVPFAPFARHRILGAIMDELRAKDHLPRPGRQRARGVEKAREKLVASLGREPTEEELAEGAGEDLATFRRRGVRQRAQTMVALEEVQSAGWQDLLASSEQTALEALCEDERVRLVAQAIRRLPERTQTILSLYYDEQLSYREIGHVLGVTESRVCQLVKEAHRLLRAQVEEATAIAA